MNILIIENEIYLAQSISTKLTELGNTCELCVSPTGKIKDIHYDVVLLSTNINGQDFTPLIKKFEKSIILLLVSYVSNNTVSIPLNLGAKDYLLKPFMINDLVRKIYHYRDYEMEKKKAQGYERYLSYIFASNKNSVTDSELELPLFVSSSFQKDADAFAYKYAIQKNESLNFITLSDKSALKELNVLNAYTLTYVTDLHMLSKNEIKIFFDTIKDKNIIVFNSAKYEIDEYNILEIKSKNIISEDSEILPIEEYIKYIIKNYQNELTDTELSKKLGMSRKSIWEKRKKHLIHKVKEPKVS